MKKYKKKNDGIEERIEKGWNKLEDVKVLTKNNLMTRKRHRDKKEGWINEESKNELKINTWIRQRMLQTQTEKGKNISDRENE